MQRDILREYHQIFLKNGIDFDYDRVVVEEKKKKEYHVPEQTKKQAEKFVEEQKTASAGMEEQQKDWFLMDVLFHNKSHKAFS